MEKINIRFKELREMCGKTQEEWAVILGLSRSGVSAIEAGGRNVTKKHILMLENWNEQIVNAEWIEKGIGKPFIDVSRGEQITKFLGSVLKDQDDSFKKRFVNVLAQLDTSDWETLEKIAEMFVEKPE